MGIVNNSFEEQGIRQLTDTQVGALGGVPGAIFGERGSQRLRTVVQSVSDILRETVALAERSDQHWRLVASQLVRHADPSVDETWWTIVEQASLAGEVRTVTTATDGRWTVVPISLSGTRRAALLIAGDWRLAGPNLLALGEQISAAFRGTRPSAASLRRASHRLARRLARTHGVSPVCAVVVEAMATAVRARLAAVAVAEPGERRLSIKATFGYPLILVEHLEIEAGQGIFGAVLASGRALRAPGGAGVVMPARRRPRYRTDSYIALPISVGDQVLAVVCVADRVDDRPFTRADLSTMRALAAPAALAFAREVASARAEAYAHAAAVDPLTGLFNRRYFHVRLEEELQRSRRHEIPLALLMMDIDDFKGVNDAYGHLAGDMVIKETAEILRRSVRVFDVCTRFGGEEYAVIMPASSEESALAVAERIRARVAAYRPTERPGDVLRVTVSIGLTLSDPNMTASDLIRRADDALYVAKRAGKNRVRAFLAQTEE